MSNNAPHEIARCLVFSTGHITVADAERLAARNHDPLIVYTNTGGWWINVPPHEEWADLDFARQLSECGYSASLVNLLQLAATSKLNCQWLMLDRDGPVRNDLPVFEW